MKRDLTLQLSWSMSFLLHYQFVISNVCLMVKVLCISDMCCISLWYIGKKNNDSFSSEHTRKSGDYCLVYHILLFHNYIKIQELPPKSLFVLSQCFLPLEISLSRWGCSTWPYFASFNPRSERPRACSRVREELVSNRECPWIRLAVAHFSFEGRIPTTHGFIPQIWEKPWHEMPGKLILLYKQTSCFLKSVIADWLFCNGFLRLTVVEQVIV